MTHHFTAEDALGETIKLNEPERQKIEKQLTLTAPELQQKGPSFLHSQITHHHLSLIHI